MSTDQNAYGTVLGPQIARTAGAARTLYGTILPPTTQVAAYVRSGGMKDQDDEIIRAKLVATLDEGLKRVRSGLGDYVMVLPDHAENISTADQMSSLRAGTKILGLGSGNRRPTFTWTAAAATFLFDQANVSLDNCILTMAATGNAGVTCAAPITVSGAGCSISNCQINFGADADDIVTIGITTTAAADDFSFCGNKCVGVTAAECTTFMQVVGADRLVMHDNFIIGATSSVNVGIVRFITTASLNIDVQNCIFVNKKASSVHGVTGVASCTGTVVNTNIGILDDASLKGWETKGNLQFFNCFVSNKAGEVGAAMLPLATGT